jgi:hypothetical protein
MWGYKYWPRAGRPIASRTVVRSCLDPIWAPWGMTASRDVRTSQHCAAKYVESLLIEQAQKKSTTSRRGEYLSFVKHHLGSSV